MSALMDRIRARVSSAAQVDVVASQVPPAAGVEVLPVVLVDTATVRIRCTEFSAFNRPSGSSFGPEGCALNTLVSRLAPKDGPRYLRGNGRSICAEDALKDAKAKGRSFVFAHLLPEQKRSSETVQVSDLVALDADGIPPEDLSRTVEQLRSLGLWFLAHSTFSDGIKEPERGRRVRFYLLPSRPLSKVELGNVTARVADVLSIQFDPSQAKPEQLAAGWCAPHPDFLNQLGLSAAHAPWREQGNGRGAVDVDAVLTQCARSPRQCDVLGMPPLQQPVAGLPVASGTAAMQENDDLSAGLALPITVERVREALSRFGSEDRDTWVRVGIHLKALEPALGAEAFSLWQWWSNNAPEHVTSGNVGENALPARWKGFAPTEGSQDAMGALCALAKRSAIAFAGGARGAPAWPDAALDAVRYLQRYHPAVVAQFLSPEFPAVPATTDHLAGDLQGLGRVVVDQHGGAVLVGALGSGARVEVWSLTDSRTSDALLETLYSRTGKLPSAAHIAANLALAGSRARRAGQQVSVYHRIAPLSGQLGVLIDLGDQDGAAVEVTAAGLRTVGYKQHGVLFRREIGYPRLPVVADCFPDRDMVLRAWGALESWLSSLRAAAVAPLLIPALVRFLVPVGTFPIIEVLGSAGQGKSTITDLLAALVSPRPDWRAVSPVDLKPATVAAACSDTEVIVFDNLSRITGEESDMLCRMASGTTLSMRELYTTAGLRTVAVHPRIILNGITPVLTRGDANDRVIRVHLSQRVTDYRSAQEIRHDFQTQHPELFRSLCVLLSAALAHWGQAGPAAHRLVEFVKVGQALAVARGLPPDTFTQAFAEHRREMAQQLGDGDPIIRVLRPVLRNALTQCVPVAEWPSWRDWMADGLCVLRGQRGRLQVAFTPSALVERMRSAAPSDLLGLGRSESPLPAHPRSLEGALLRVAPLLRGMGWDIEKLDFAKGRPAWVFSQVRDRTTDDPGRHL